MSSEADDDSENRPTEGARSYQSNLVVLCDQVKAELIGVAAGPGALTAAQTETITKVAELLALPVINTADWSILNEAELRLVGIMPDQMVTAEMPSHFDRAVRLGVPEVVTLKAYFDKAESDGERRSIASVLLRRMYVRYTDRRVDRTERKQVDRRMGIFGFSILIGFLFTVTLLLILGFATKLNCVPPIEPVAVVSPSAAEPAVVPDAASDTGASQTGKPSQAEVKAMQGLSCLTSVHWLVVAYFGVVGAFFSRFGEYRKARYTLGWEDLKAGYSSWVIFGRLMIGAFGAILFFFVMGGNLLAGQLFLTTDFKLWDALPNGSSRPTQDFFRLLVWSTIAGFSERLVPDRFDEIANSAAPKG